MEKIKLRIYFFFLICLLFNLKINCESNDCQNCKIEGSLCKHTDEIRENCLSGCRLNLITKKCHNCGDIGRGDYYEFNTDSTCSKIGKSSCSYILYNTFQCVSSCPDDYPYSMGNYCYQSCSGNMKIKAGESKECECSFKFYKEVKDEKTQFLCLSSNVLCNPEHKSYYLNECSNDACDGSKKMKVEYREGLSNIFRCSDNCENNEFLYNYGSNTYCLDSCPKNKYLYYITEETINSKVCTEQCIEGYPYLKEKECIKNCNNFNGTKCIDPNLCLRKKDDNICVPYCDDGYSYEDVGNHICYDHCPSKYITQNNKCFDINNLDKCFYFKETEDASDIICYSSCKDSPYPYLISGSKKCVGSCTNEYYRFENEQICYNSLDSIPYIQGENYYCEDNKVCHCFLYGIKDGEYVCYNDEKSCYDAGFRYKKNNNQCLNECTSFIYTVPKNENEPKLDECYDRIEECRNKNYYYYNTNDRKCYISLPPGTNPNENDSENLPQEDEGRNTYTYGCGSLRFPKKTTKGICKKDCDKDEYFKPSNPNQCLSNCKADDNDQTIYYIGYNNECLTSCPDYYIVESGKNKCVQNCKDYGKYYFQGDHKCYNSCKEKDSNNYFYNLGDNKCVKTCMDNSDGNKYAYDNTYAPQPCLAKPEGKYYDINNIILTEKCKLISLNDPQKCVDHCNGMKVYNKRCVSQCPDLEGPYVHVPIEEGSNIYIDKCVRQCPENYKLIAYRNECVDKCPKNYITDKDGRCFYANCPKGLKYNPSSLKCEDCSPYEKKVIKIKNENNDEVDFYIYICKSSCNTELKYIKDINDQECVDHCPSENNYIGGDYICRTHCNGNHSYFDHESDSINYYKCVKHCPTEDGYFYIVEYKGGERIPKEECVLTCPETFPFGVKNKYECLQSCPSGKPYFYKDEKTDNDKYYTCTSKFKCGHGSYNNKKYFCEDNCYNADGIKGKNRIYIENNICVEKCSNNYKKQRENYGNDDIIICKPECDPNEYIKGDECLKKCPRDLNYIGNNNICKNSCREEDQANKYYLFETVTNENNANDNYPVYKCVKECPYNFIYNSNDNLCLNSCGERFLSKEENFCHINCFLHSENSKFSLSIVDGGNTIGKCLSECNDPHYPTYKYYYENVKVCLEKCNNDDYAVDVTNICVRDCGSLDGNYYFYEIDDSNTNIKQKKFCVKQCPSSKNFLRGKTCHTSCDTNSEEKFHIKEYKHDESDLQRICLTDCKPEYPYYYGDGKYECIEACQTGHYYVPNYSSYKNAKLCVEECKFDSQNYNYKIENKTSKVCYKECPSERPYHKDISKDQYKLDNNCYDECPPDAPFHEKAADKTGFVCKTLEECKFDYVDYETKECLAKDETCPSERKLSIYNGKKVCLNECISPYGKYPTFYKTCVNDCENDALATNLHLKKDPQSPKCICENLYYKLDDGTIKCFENSINKECKEMDHHKINLHGTKECILTCDGIGILSPLEDICFNDASYDCSNYLNTQLYDKINNENDEAKKKCDCVEKYYFKDNGEKICLARGEICPKGYDQKYIPEKMQCLKDGKDCPEPFTHLFNGKYCLRICPSNSTESEDKKCSCEHPYNYWREVSHSNFECIIDCYNIHLVSIPSENNKCVEKCEGKYSRFYNNECYSSCDATIDTNIKILDAIEVYDKSFDLSKYRCECKPGDSWYIDNTKIKHCISNCQSVDPPFEYTIKSTSQCVNTCPPEYYIFNNECFTSCEDEAYSKYHLNVKYVEPYQDCQCRGIWHYTDNENKIKECLMEDICALPNTEKKFLFNSTQCLEECPDGWVGFNYLCSNNCPEKTIDKKSENGVFDCSCNLNDGYWYEYQ